MHKMDVFVNKSGGSVLRLGEDRVAALIQEGLGARMGALNLMNGDELSHALKKVTGKNPLLIGGGDGTAVCAAQILSPRDIPFGILPLGTMNLLAQDLGAYPTFEQTLESFDNFSLDTIDAGMVNGKLFLCSAVIGFVPEGAVAREELRDNTTIENMTKFFSTIRRGMGGDMSQILYLRGKESDQPFGLETTSLIISNNSFAPSTPESGRFLRETLKDGKLAVYSASPKNMLDGLKIAFSMWQGNWQDHESILSFETEELIVDAQEKKILISLDGEPVEMTGPLRFSIQRQTIPVLRMMMKTE